MKVRAYLLLPLREIYIYMPTFYYQDSKSATKQGAFEGLLPQSPINMHTFCYPGTRNTTKQGALESLLAQSPINMHTFCDLGAKRGRKQGHSTLLCKNAHKTRVGQSAAPPTAEVIFKLSKTVHWDRNKIRIRG